MNPPVQEPERLKQIILAAVLFLYCAAFSYILTRQPLLLVRSDHFSRWYATEQLLKHGRSLYDPRNGQEIVALNDMPVDPLEGSFFYPAHLILLTAPLVIFTYPVAHFIWVLLIQLFMLAGTWLVARLSRWPDSTNSLTIFLLLALFFIPHIQNTIWGQFNTVSVISLAVVYLFLQRGRYALAGLFAIGLTFKPQTALLAIAFLLIWALFERRRWGFLLSFGLAGLGCWLFAEWLEPGWAASFWDGLRAYSAHHTPASALETILPSSGILEAALILFSLGIAIALRRSRPDSPAFAAGLVISLAAGWLVVPFLGMMPLVGLPLALALVFGPASRSWPRLHQLFVAAALLIYLLGLAGFLYGLSSPQLYGLHIQLAELVYKTLAPILLILLAGWLIQQNRSQRLESPGS